MTAAAYDGYGHTNLLELQKTLVILFFIGLLLLFITCYFLVRASLKPIREIVKEAETITASRIDQRLPVRNEKDELGELSQAFNELLERLEISFNSQKMFVSNVSHEMRTPAGCPHCGIGLMSAEGPYRNTISSSHAERATGCPTNDKTD